MLRVENVSKYYGTKKNLIQALDNVSFEMGKGDFIAITGASGSGKTTLLNLIGGMTRPDKGSVSVAGKNLTHMSDREISRFRAHTIGFIFQFQSMIPTLTVLENVKLPLLFRDKQDTHHAAETLIERVGLRDRLGAHAQELSVGQQRRVSIARALVNEPALLLCDEPTGDLDPKTESVIMEIIAAANQAGTTVLMATHNHALRAQATGSVIIENGRIAEDRGQVC